MLAIKRNDQIITKNAAAGNLEFNRFCKNPENSTATITALISEIGLEKVVEIIKIARAENKSVKVAALLSGFVAEEKFEIFTFPKAICHLGN